MITATPKNLEWLFEKLYAARRAIASSDPSVSKPVFVLLTKSEDERHIVENEIYRHFIRRYGVTMLHTKAVPSASDKALTRLELPEIGASVMLMDVE